LFVAAVALVSAMNIVIQEGAKTLVDFERHKSKTAAAAQQQLKTFIGLLVNTGFIVVVVNSPFAYGSSSFFFLFFFFFFFSVKKQLTKQKQNFFFFKQQRTNA
jgi:hypothetical protein